MLKKLTTQSKWFKEKSQPLTIGVVFTLMFIYGSLILMVGYTNVGLNQITGLSGGETVWLAIPQSVALTIGTYSLKYFLKKFNIRTIFFFGYGLVLICLILISQLDHISGANGTNPSNSSKHTALGLYIVFNFFLGLGLAPTSPINSIYLSTIFRGKKRGFFLSASNGVYGVGGGIIPLAAASAIYRLQHNGAAHFATLRFFYYIAIGLAIVGMVAACFSYYKQAEQTLTIKDMRQKVDQTVKKATTKKFFVTAVILVIVMYIFYMLPETFSNYSFTTFIKNGDDSRSITATQCFGLFLVVQGLWRCVSGFTVTRWFRFRTFLTYSVVFIIAGFAILSSGLLNSNVNWGFLVAVLIGLGFGNMWPIMFSYASGINDEKAAFMGVAINITSMGAIPVFQLLAGGLYNLSPTAEAIVALCSAFFLFVMIWTLSTYLRKNGQPHKDDLRKSSFPWKKHAKTNAPVTKEELANA